MQSFRTYTARDLRNLSGQITQQAEQGKLGLITKHGKPIMLTVPFDELVLSLGVHRALALQLFEAGQLSLSQAAKLADVSVEDMLALMAEAGIDAVNYPDDELQVELEHVL